MKFRAIKQDIKKGIHLDYYFTYYKYEVSVSVLHNTISYLFTSKDGSSCVAFTIPRDEYMKMKYKDFLNIVHQHLYYNCGEECVDEK